MIAPRQSGQQRGTCFTRGLVACLAGLTSTVAVAAQGRIPESVPGPPLDLTAAEAKSIARQEIILLEGGAPRARPHERISTDEPTPDGWRQHWKLASASGAEVGQVHIRMTSVNVVKSDTTLMLGVRRVMVTPETDGSRVVEIELVVPCTGGGPTYVSVVRGYERAAVEMLDVPEMIFRGTPPKVPVPRVRGALLQFAFRVGCSRADSVARARAAFNASMQPIMRDFAARLRSQSDALSRELEAALMSKFRNWATDETLGAYRRLRGQSAGWSLLGSSPSVGQLSIQSLSDVTLRRGSAPRHPLVRLRISAADTSAPRAASDSVRFEELYDGEIVCAGRTFTFRRKIDLARWLSGRTAADTSRNELMEPTRLVLNGSAGRSVIDFACRR